MKAERQTVYTRCHVNVVITPTLTKQVERLEQDKEHNKEAPISDIRPCKQKQLHYCGEARMIDRKATYV